LGKSAYRYLLLGRGKSGHHRAL